jgi:hypothetical protein
MLLPLINQLGGENNFFCFCVLLSYAPDCQLILFDLAIYYLVFIEVNICVKRTMMLDYFTIYTLSFAGELWRR